MPDPTDASNGAQSAPTAEEIAQRVFPSMAPPATASAAPAQPGGAAPSATASQEDGPLPVPEEPADAEMKALRADAAYNMFSRSEAARVVPDNAFDALVGTTIEVDGQQVQMEAAAARQAVVELRAIVADLDLSTNDLAAVQAGLSLGESIRADEQKKIAARESAVEMLNREHGQEAMQAFRAAHAYVAKNPKLASILDRTGAGDAPEVVKLIARRALALHKAGKLTVPRREQGAQGTATQGLYSASNMNP